MAITPLNLKMKRLLALLALAPLLASPLSARADLGAAEKIKGEFDAWCAKGGNKCKVTFSEDNLTVDGSSSITKTSCRKFPTTTGFIARQPLASAHQNATGKARLWFITSKTAKKELEPSSLPTTTLTLIS